VPKIIQEAELKKVIWGMFLVILVLGKGLGILAYFIHQSAVSGIEQKIHKLEQKVEMNEEEARRERKELTDKVHKIDVLLAPVIKKP
jgi:hypothetical protein